MARQIWEIVRLRFAVGKIKVREYYDYNLYDDYRFSFAAKREFMGVRKASRLYGPINQRTWIGVADDKPVLYAVLRSLGLPIPELYAAYYPRPRFFGAVPSFTDAGLLADFLRHGIPYPFFAKPIRGKHGVGASAVMAFNQESDQLILANRETVRVDRYVAELSGDADPKRPRVGHLLQECLLPHPEILELCGGGLSSVRMIVFLCRSGPRLIRAIWKIPTGGNMTDNFRHGLSGNLLGSVDVETGAVKRIIRGIGPAQVEVTVHPDTKKSLTNAILPNWPNAVSVCLAGASALPGLRWQSWDIGLCPKGAVILELNAYGDIDLLQHLGAGLYDADFRDCLAQLAPRTDGTP